MKRSEVLQLLNLKNADLNRLLSVIDKSLFDAQEIPDELVEQLLKKKEGTASNKGVGGGELTTEQQTIQELDSGDRAYRDSFTLLRQQSIQRAVSAGVLTGAETLRAYVAAEAQSFEELSMHLNSARAKAMFEIYDNPMDQLLGEFGISPVTATMGRIAGSIPQPVKPCLPNSYLNRRN